MNMHALRRCVKHDGTKLISYPHRNSILPSASIPFTTFLYAILDICQAIPSDHILFTLSCSSGLFLSVPLALCHDTLFRYFFRTFSQPLLVGYIPLSFSSFHYTFFFPPDLASSTPPDLSCRVAREYIIYALFVSEITICESTSFS